MQIKVLVRGMIRSIYLAIFSSMRNRDKNELVNEAKSYFVLTIEWKDCLILIPEQSDSSV